MHNGYTYGLGKIRNTNEQDLFESINQASGVQYGCLVLYLMDVKTQTLDCSPFIVV